MGAAAVLRDPAGSEGPVRAVALESGLLDLCHWRALGGGDYWSTVLDGVVHADGPEFCPVCLIGRAAEAPSVHLEFGTADDLVSPEHSRRFLTALTEAGGRDVAVLERAGRHVPALAARVRSRASMLAFMATRLGLPLS